MAKLDQAIALIDAVNAADPNRELFAGREQPKELLYSQRMTSWLEKLEHNASEALQLAARGQHIARWSIPRDSYPMDRAGYHRWRGACQQMHSDQLAEILRRVGYDVATIARVKSLVRKERMKLDPEAQLLEDVVCLVFLENYFADFARAHDEAKLIEIVRKTWKKMSHRGQQAALRLPLSQACRQIVEKAVSAQ